MTTRKPRNIAGLVLAAFLLGAPGASRAETPVAPAVVPDNAATLNAPATDNAAGLATAPDNAAALAEAMRELADANERARCRQATDHLAAELSIDRHVDQVEALLKEAAEA